MVVFWFVVVGGGLLGLAVPHLQITALMARALPKRLQANPFVFNLVHPKTAQVHSFLGFPVPRPAAPFVFTNDWGGNFALLVPFVLASWSPCRSCPSSSRSTGRCGPASASSSSTEACASEPADGAG
jgi:hypothetical protein